MRGQGGREARVEAGRKQGWVRQEETHPSPAGGRGWVPAKGVLVMPRKALTSHFWKERSRAFSSRNRARTYRKWGWEVRMWGVLHLFLDHIRVSIPSKN